MSDEAWGFAPPPFKGDEAIQRLRRDLREMGLTEREGRWERRGRLICQLEQQGDCITARRVKKPARSSPEWLSRELKSGAQVRDFTADLKKQLASWSDDHD